MTRADSTLVLGRSRDTLFGAAFPPDPAPIIPRRRVELRLWGCTRADIPAAETAALTSVGAEWWDVVEITATCGGLCPIPMHDRIAAGQGADYDSAWAAYPVWGR
jgi:hypothetical protein